MLKMFLTKDVAVQYVAVKAKEGKEVMSQTTFYDCIQCKIYNIIEMTFNIGIYKKDIL